MTRKFKKPAVKKQQVTKPSLKKAPPSNMVRKHKNSSSFSTSKVIKKISKVKTNDSHKVVNSKKVGKEDCKKIAKKTRKMAALQNKIEIMNKRIKNAELKSKLHKADEKPKVTKVVKKVTKVVKKVKSKDKMRKAKAASEATSSSGKKSKKLKVRSSSTGTSNSKLVKSKKSCLNSKSSKKEISVKRSNSLNKKITVSKKNESSTTSKSLKSSSRKRKLQTSECDDDQGHKVAYIHVGEGGERDLEEHLRGSSKVNIQVLSTERLPDIDDTDMIHGLDHAGTSRDYVDERHRCTVRCPVGCQGHLRPNEIIIYESIRYDGRLLGRKRIKGRFVEGDVGEEDVTSLVMTEFRRIGSRGNRRRMDERSQRRRMITQQRYRRTVVEDRNDAPIPPEPSSVGIESGLPQRVSVLMDTVPVDREIAEAHSWNPNDRSFNVVLKEDDPLTMRRHPVAQSTDCIRGKVGYSSGTHLWEVTWPVRQRGTHAVVGVATKEAVLHSVGYQSLVGNTSESWGWDLGRKKAYHNSGVNEGTNYPPMITHHHQWTVPDQFLMVLDMDIGNLGYIVADQFLGWSHSNVKSGERVYPIVSTVWGHCEVRLKYLGGLESGVAGLQDLTRGTIRTAIGRKKIEQNLDSLRLPTKLKNYLK